VTGGDRLWGDVVGLAGEGARPAVGERLGERLRGAVHDRRAVLTSSAPRHIRSRARSDGRGATKLPHLSLTRLGLLCSLSFR
jgi:hypothetical protein